MGNDHCEVKVSDIAASTRNALVGGPFGSNLVSRDYVDSGVPVIRGQNMGGRWVSGEFAFVSEDKADSLRSNLAHPGDIVFTQRGTLGQVSLVPPEPYNRYLVSQSQMKLTVDNELADPLFYYYVFSSPSQQEYIQQNTIQSGVPHTNLGTLRESPIPLPPLSAQRDIANILGTLDDKIELNRQMNRTLEAMARAIFKAWFVDFEPVKAKAAGATSFRGMSQPVFDQLPDRFTDTELGPMPEGWQIGNLGQVMEHPRRIISPAEIDEATPYIGLEHMPRRSIALPEWGRAGTVTSGKHQFFRGELLFGKLRPYFHKVGIAPVDGVCSTDVVVVKPKGEEWAGYVLGHISSSDFVAYTTAASTGTKMPRTNWKDMSRYAVVLPAFEVTLAFSELMAPLTEWIVAGIHESQTLAAIRDTLLPKLISGELRISDACQLLENTA